MLLAAITATINQMRFIRRCSAATQDLPTCQLKDLHSIQSGVDVPLQALPEGVDTRVTGQTRPASSQTVSGSSNGPVGTPCGGAQHEPNQCAVDPIKSTALWYHQESALGQLLHRNSHRVVLACLRPGPLLSNDTPTSNTVADHQQHCC